MKLRGLGLYPRPPSCPRLIQREPAEPFKVFAPLKLVVVDDQGVNVALLNTLSLDAPSYLWAERWDSPRLIYGDILPGLGNGQLGVVTDISSGGSLWLQTRIWDGTEFTYSVTNLQTSVTSVPEPPTDVLLEVGVLLLLVWKHIKGTIHFPWL